VNKLSEERQYYAVGKNFNRRSLVTYSVQKVRKTMRNVRGNNRLPERDQNPRSSEYEVGVLRKCIMTNIMHKFYFYFSIYFCLTYFRLSFIPSSEAGVQLRQWFKSLGYGVSARALTPYPKEHLRRK
jgi:hypothetical protein